MADEKNVAMSDDLAVTEFNRWAEENGIDVDTTSMNDEEKSTFDSQKRTIVKSIAKGQTVVNDNDDLEITLGAKNPEGYAGTKLVFKAPSAQAYLGMDNFKPNQNVHKMVAYMSAMTGKDIAYFSKIANADFKLFMAVATFFITN